MWVVNNARVPSTMRERFFFFVVKCLSKIRAFAIGFSITYKNGISHILFSSLCVIRRFSDGGRIGSYFTYLNREKIREDSLLLYAERGVSSLFVCMSFACPVNINIYIKIVITFCVFSPSSMQSCIVLLSFSVWFSYSFKKHQNALYSSLFLPTYQRCVICVIS